MDEYRRAARLALGEMFLEPPSRDDLFAAVASLSDAGIDFIAIDGGDGTVSDVLTAIYRAYPLSALPAVAVLPSGNTNLIAGDVGFGHRGLPALERLLELRDSGDFRRDVRRRQPLVVRWSDPARPPVLGMFHGTAGFTWAIELAHQPAILDRYSHDTAVVMTLLSALSQLIRAKSRRAWLGGSEIRISIGAQNGEVERCFVFLATTLRRLSRGVWPFWRTAGADGGMMYLNVGANPPRLARGLVALLRGQAPAWMRASDSWRSGNAQRITLQADTDFVLDGEVLSPGPDGITHLSCGPAFDFVQAA
ncbi:diacylglycerol kinase [Ameyamaea chiangmaiensis]|uniref:Diacylglycerol kinase n=2 Tax=Ameyamaea chiangmaiensis TaxID=442969 RepID=A0A850PIB5_9PROT|nr:diacylglycerol kinase [Ameyamaea chiangmaiensis]NVN40971.1 diacylglycerol kinase [Ameyamaea chiangmaiensis]